MVARITISQTPEGFLEISVNEDGRDQLVRELQALSRTSDHFHLGPVDLGEVELSNRPYNATDTIVEWGKVLFRPDDWDAEFFPHVLGRNL